MLVHDFNHFIWNFRLSTVYVWTMYNRLWDYIQLICKMLPLTHLKEEIYTNNELIYQIEFLSQLEESLIFCSLHYFSSPIQQFLSFSNYIHKSSTQKPSTYLELSKLVVINWLDFRRKLHTNLHFSCILILNLMILVICARFDFDWILDFSLSWSCFVPTLSFSPSFPRLLPPFNNEIPGVVLLHFLINKCYLFYVLWLILAINLYSCKFGTFSARWKVW